VSEHEKHDVMDDDCLDAMDHLYEYLNGEITDEETLAMMKQHLSHCHSCFSRAEFERALNERLKKSGKPTTPKSLQNRLKDLMESF
jgi:anti-sigma factor (TIGR02949 family)